MKEMKTLKLPGQAEAYEVVDAHAREQIDTKADISYVDDELSGKVDKVGGKGLSTNDYTTEEKNKLANIAAGAEVNQNAFSKIVVGSTNIEADVESDSLTIAAGTGIAVSGDVTNDKITITNSGVRSISTGDINGTISVNTNGASTNVAVKGLGSAAYTDSTVYDAAGTAQAEAGSALSSAKSYTDSALSAAKTYADNAAATVKDDLLNGAGAAYDTLKELGDLIVDNADAIDALEKIASGKADAEHAHDIEDVSGLQNALDGKAASSHGTHVTYSTTAPIMDGTASAGSASSVARSDHKHPTDTSRASKTEFDTHVSDTTKHITSTERTNWGTAYTHSQSTHAPSNAEKNQNAFSNIKVGSTTIAADSTTDTLELVGSNITITPDSTNDKVTIAVANGTASAKGVVQLTDSTSSTSTTTAATPNSVKSAYDLANTAKTNASNAQIKADSAYSLAESKANASHDHTISDITNMPAIPTKTSDLLNDSGFKTTDNNTTYDFSSSRNSTNGNVSLKLTNNNSETDSIVIIGTGGTNITTDSNGVVMVDSNKVTMKTWTSSDMV